MVATSLGEVDEEHLTGSANLLERFDTATRPTNEQLRFEEADATEADLARGRLTRSVERTQRACSRGSTHLIRKRPRFEEVDDKYLE
jgi:hypothetical protein